MYVYAVNKCNQYIVVKKYLLKSNKSFWHLNDV